MKVKDIDYVINDLRYTEAKKWNKLFDVNTEYLLGDSRNPYMYGIRTNGTFSNTYWTGTFGARPVVSLKTTVKTCGFDLNAIWNIQL